MFWGYKNAHNKKVVSVKKYGRGDGIRTHGLYVPNVALYQTEPHLDMCGKYPHKELYHKKISL